MDNTPAGVHTTVSNMHSTTSDVHAARLRDIEPTMAQWSEGLQRAEADLGVFE
jgi:hypothetical protein